MITRPSTFPSLSKLSPGKHASIWGFVIDISHPNQSRSNLDHYCKLLVSDETEVGMTCLYFNRNPEMLPTALFKNSIIRLQNVQLQLWSDKNRPYEFNDAKRQIVGNKFSSFQLYDISPTASKRPLQQSSPYSLSKVDDAMITYLRQWCASMNEEISLSTSSTLCDDPPGITSQLDATKSNVTKSNVTKSNVTKSTSASEDGTHPSLTIEASSPRVDALHPPAPPSSTLLQDDRPVQPSNEQPSTLPTSAGIAEPPLSTHKYLKISPMKIQDILRFPHPTFKFRLIAQLTGISPRDPSRLTRPVCPYCSAFLSQLLPEDGAITCPDCLESDIKPAFAYVFQLTLRDETGEIRVLAWRSQAEEFLHGLPPLNLTENTCAQESLKYKIQQMMGHQLDLCLFSYFLDASTPDDRRYQLFDTVLTLTQIE